MGLVIIFPDVSEKRSILKCGERFMRKQSIRARKMIKECLAKTAPVYLGEAHCLRI